MKVAEDPIAVMDTIDRIKRQMEGVREEGTHVSELIFCLRKAFLTRLGGGRSLPPSTTLVFATGRAIQDYITGKPAEESERHMYEDGIWGTADYVDDAGHPWEIKATYASAARNVVEDTPHYLDQLAAYCHMLGTTEGYLAIFYINGYYDFMRKNKRANAVDGERSILKVYHVIFEQQELDSAWERYMARSVLLNRAEELEDIPVSLHYGWECGYCPLYNNGCSSGNAGYRNHWIGSMEWE